MKKVIIAALVVLSTSAATACDICGCGVSNYNPFLFPHLAKTHIGVNYLNRAYNVSSDHGKSIERYHTLLVSGQYNIGEKVQLVAMMPYQFNSLSNNAGAKNLNGVGDVSILGNYKLIDRLAVTRQTVMIGAGVKMPTGKYATAGNEEVEDQNFQLGTGTVDYLLNASYNISYNKLSLRTLGSYKYNTANKDGYRYGDVATLSATMVYRHDLKKISVAPYLQAIHETQMNDAASHVLQQATGGNVLYTGGGVDINTRKVACGLGYQFVPKQNLAQQKIEVRPRISAHISIIL